MEGVAAVQSGSWRFEVGAFVGLATLSVVGFAGLAIALNDPAAPGRGVAFFVPPFFEVYDSSRTTERVPVPLTLVRTCDGVNEHEIRLESTSGPGLKGAGAVGLAVATYGREAKVQEATLEAIAGGETRVLARLQEPAVGVLRDGAHLELVMEDRAGWEGGGIDHLRLRLWSRGSPDLALWGQRGPERQQSPLIWRSPNGGGQVSIFGWAGRSRGESGLKKRELLAYAWGFGTNSSGVITGVVWWAAAIWVVGILTFARGMLTVGRFSHLAFGTGVGAMFVGLGLVCCLLFPPFQMPDEADHFLTYARIQSDQKLAGDALDLALLGHFERIKFHSNEGLSAMDVGTPQVGGWASHIGETNPDRSIVARGVWSSAGKVLPKSSVGETILSIRVINVVLVAVCLTIGFATSSWLLKTGTVSAIPALVWIAVPSVPFFVSGVSNYAFLICGLILQMVGLGLVLRQCEDFKDCVWAGRVCGLLIGAGVVIGLASADNGIFNVVFWAAWLVIGSFVAGVVPRKVAGVGLQDLVIGGGCGAVGAVIVTGMLCGRFGFMPPMLTGLLSGLFEGILFSKWGIDLVFFGLCGIGLGMMVLVYKAGRLFSTKPRVVTVLQWIVIGSFVILGVAALLLPLLPIPDIQGQPLRDGLGVYVSRVLYSFLEGFGPGGADPFVTTSFWGLFGWLDTQLPDWMLGIMRIGCGLGVVLFVTAISREGGILTASALVGSVAAMVAVIGVGYYLVDYNVHGRYLIGAYLIILVLSTEGYRRAGASLVPKGSARVCGLCAVVWVAMLLHFCAWTTVLNRYLPDGRPWMGPGGSP